MTDTLANNQLEMLRLLSQAVGVSGAEGDVRKLIRETIKANLSDLSVDTMGNLSAVLKGTGGSVMRVLVSAHMDEIGFMVASINDNGLINIVDVGVHDNRYTPTQPLLVGKDKTPGVFIWKPIHQSIEQQTIIESEDMLIDVGASDKGGVKAKPGEYVAFASRFTELSPTVVRGKAFDSRAACIALIGLLSGDPFPHDLHGVFTTQALIGGRGAAIAAYRAEPQAAFSLTGFAANDLPGDPSLSDYAPIIRLGGGPVLSALDGRTVGNRRLLEHVRSVAKAKGIPIQLHASNDIQQPEGSRLKQIAAGIPTLMIGVPIRYMGSPNSLMNLTDLQSLIDLMRESLAALTPDVLETHNA